MIIESIITLVDTDMRPGNPYGDTLKLQWINEVDGSIWNEIYKYKTTADIMRLIGVAAYALPVGVDFNKVTDVYVEGDEIPRITAAQKDTTGYFRGADGKLNIYPAPTAADVTAGLTVGYIVPFTPHTADTETPYAEAPYDKVYYHYLCAQIDFLQKDYESYNNEMAQYNAAMKEYMLWWEGRET